MDLFIIELKRQIRLKSFIIYMLLPIILAILWAWFIIGGRTEGFLMTNCYKGLKGMKAIETAAKDRNVYSGKMTIDKYQKGGEVFLNSKTEDDKIVVNDDLLKFEVYADTLLTQSYRLNKLFGGDINTIENFSSDFGSHFYENEDLYYKSIINSKAKNETEKQLASKLWNKVDKPYTYYGGFEVWRDGVEHIQLFTFVLLIIVGFFASRIIVKDKEYGFDEIISTTRRGRKKLIFSKLSIPVLMGLIIYAVGMGTYIAILKHYLPANALETSAQIFSGTILPYNLGEVMRKMIVLGLLGIFSICAFTTFASSIVKKSSSAISITVLVILSGFILSLMFESSNPIIKAINLILPGNLVFCFSDFMYFPVTSAFGKPVLSLSLNLFIGLIIFIINWILTSWNYVRR